MDCIAEGTSPKICCDAISSKGGVISYLLGPPKHEREDVEARKTLGYTAVGEDKKFRGTEVPAKPEDFEFQKK